MIFDVIKLRSISLCIRPNKNDNIHRIMALIANTYHIYNCKLPFHVLFIIQYIHHMPVSIPLRKNINSINKRCTNFFIIVITILLMVSLASLCVYNIHKFRTRKSMPSYFFLLCQFTCFVIIHVLRVMKIKVDIQIWPIGLHNFYNIFKLLKLHDINAGIHLNNFTCLENVKQTNKKKYLNLYL